MGESSGFANPSATDDDVGIDLSLHPPSKLLKQDEDTAGKPFDIDKPTCSINLICQRNGFLQKYQIHVINKDRCATHDQFDNLITNVKGFIKTDTLGIVNSIDSSTSNESIRNQPLQNIPPDQDQAKKTADPISLPPGSTKTIKTKALRASRSL